MKKQMRFCILAGVLALLTLLTSCGRNHLEYDPQADAYVRRGDGAVFYRASENFLAVNIDMDREICKIKQASGEDILLYEISNFADSSMTDSAVYMDASVWMGDYDHRVYYAAGTVLPKLWEMQIKEIYMTDGGEMPRVIDWVEDAGEVAQIIGLYQNGTAFGYSDLHASFGLTKLKQRNELAFVSQNYQGLYYMLSYLQYEESVTYTEEVADPATFVPRYPRNYRLQETDGVTYAKYDLGTAFLYDHVSGQCYPLDDLADIFE